jgi:hypothetical protein
MAKRAGGLTRRGDAVNILHLGYMLQQFLRPRYSTLEIEKN